jgi:hypothetical protein
LGIIPLLIISQTASLLGEFCALGPRVPGSAAHRKARDFIVRRAGEATVDSFVYEGTTFFNIIVSFNEAADRRIGFATHWDSRPVADQEKKTAKRRKPIIGANDGGSGVAIFLALIDSLKRRPPPIGVDLIFFDGEDFGPEPMLLGSKEFARRCDRHYEYVALIDMVGDKDLTLFREGYSVKYFPTLVDSIWQIGRRINPRVFRNEVKYYVVDDHLSLIERGIRAVDIIDFNYRHWHTLQDTPDKCSESSLDLVLELLMKLAYEQR